MNEQQINLTVTVREADAILASLAKRPLEEVIDLFIKIKSQGASQIAPAAPEAKDGGPDEQ
jgi:hypothetical protein